MADDVDLVDIDTSQQWPTMLSVAKTIEIAGFESVWVYDHFHTGRHGRPSGYLIEGLGDEEIIGCPDFELIDEAGLHKEDGVAEVRFSAAFFLSIFT